MVICLPLCEVLVWHWLLLWLAFLQDFNKRLETFIVGQGTAFAWQEPLPLYLCSCMPTGQAGLYTIKLQLNSIWRCNISFAGLSWWYSFTTVEYEMCCFSGVFVRIKGEPLHPECFKCVKCGKNLKNQGLFFAVPLTARFISVLDLSLRSLLCIRLMAALALI